jgi:hypothetical protein
MQIELPGCTAAAAWAIARAASAGASTWTGARSTAASYIAGGEPLELHAGQQGEGRGDFGLQALDGLRPGSPRSRVRLPSWMFPAPSPAPRGRR